MTHDTNVSTNNNTKNVAVPTPAVEVKSSDGNVSRPSQVDGSPEQQIVCATTNSSSLAVVKGGAPRPHTTGKEKGALMNSTVSMQRDYTRGMEKIF